MVLLKNNNPLFQNEVCYKSFLKDNETDCILYSNEGIKFNVHKEIFYQTKMMRNILVSDNERCCKNIEILCPCSETELESVVNFLYSSTISIKEEGDIEKILDNLTEIFGFSQELFSLQEQTVIK